MKLELGLQQAHYSKIVNEEQFIVGALVRLLRLEEQDELKQKLAGNYLGIVGTG